MSPPVTYDSYESAVVANAITMLASSAYFQAFVLAQGSVAADLIASAKKRIVESDGGDDLDNAATDKRKGSKIKITACDDTQFEVSIPIDVPFAKLHLTACEHPQSPGIGVFTHRGTVMIWYLQPWTSESAAARMRRARNTSGLIRRDLEAQTGLDGCLSRFSITPTGPFIADDTGPYRRTVGFAHQIDWSAP